MAEAGDEEPVDELNRPRPESALSVREVQARLRAGRTIDEVAAEAHMEPAWVARFAAPIVAEQAQMVAAVRASHIERARAGPSDLPLGEAVYRNLAERGVAATGDELDHNWSARQLTDGLWLVTFRYQSRGKWQTASWEYDERSDVVRAHDRLGSQLAFRPPRAPVGTTRTAPTRRRPPGRKVASARKVAATRMATAAKKSAVRGQSAARKAAEAKAAAAKKAADDKAREAAKKAADREKAKRARERARAAAKKAADREKAKRAREKAAAAKAVPPPPPPPPKPKPTKKAAAPTPRKRTPRPRAVTLKKRAAPPPAPVDDPVLAAEAAPDGPEVRPERTETTGPEVERRRPLQVRRELEVPAVADESEVDALLEQAAGTGPEPPVEGPRFSEGAVRVTAEPDDNGQEPPPAVSVRPPRRRRPRRGDPSPSCPPPRPLTS